MKLGFVGCGFMGEAMLSAILAKGVVSGSDVFVSDINDERCGYVDRTFSVRTTGDFVEVAEAADTVIFAVKPQEFDQTAHRVEGKFRRDQTVISIMAGVPIEKIARSLRHAGIVRAMPNTPAAVGEGMSVWTATPEVDAATRAQVSAIFGAMGREMYVDDEKYLDMATALSASGPGFVYLLIEAFIDAGVHIGYKREVAQMLALQTFIGSAKYMEATGKHPAELRNQVTSPGGTTAAGLIEMENAGVRGAIIDAIDAAYNRSKELGA